MDQALKSGCTDIRVQTDSNLVSQQVQGSWKVRSDNLIPLNNEVQNMKNNFNSFDIQYVPREMNYDADSLANAGVNLPEGKIQTEYYGVGRRY
ncbi:unnamed protein product [Cuscuta campestris]|nr:unnamed protein product [Cuscuta campestris]